MGCEGLEAEGVACGASVEPRIESASARFWSSTWGEERSGGVKMGVAASWNQGSQQSSGQQVSD